MWGLGHPGEIFSRAAAGINVAARDQFTQGCSVYRVTFALVVWRERAANVRALLPANTERVEVLDGRNLEFRLRSLRIEVFHAENQRALRIDGATPSGPESRRVPKMEQSGWRWRDAAAIAGLAHESESNLKIAELRAQRPAFLAAPGPLSQGSGMR